MPKAPPKSMLVCEIAAAEPACSGGAAPTMVAFASAAMGPAPTVATTEPMTRTARPPTDTNVSSANASAQTSAPPIITVAGGARRTSLGAIWEAMTMPIAHGSVQRPACSGERPSTSWRYCAVKNDDANITKALSVSVTTVALNTGMHWVGEAALTTDEQRTKHHTGRDRSDRDQAQTVLSHELQAEDRGKHGHDRERGARDIHAPRVRVAELRKESRSEEQEQRHHGHSDQEHGAPPEVLQDHPAQEWTKGAASREASNPNTHGHRPLLLVQEHVADERWPRRSERCAAHTEDPSSTDEHPR